MTPTGTDDVPRLDDQICFALYAATHAITRRYRPLLDEIGLTYPQYLLMLIVWQQGPMTVGQIARRLELDSHAVTPLVARLEAAGLLRRASGTDRRQVMITVTDRGHNLQAAAGRAQTRVAAATGLDPLELTELRRQLRQLTDRLTHESPFLPAARGRRAQPRRELL